MSTPALIYLALTILGMGIILSKHGQPQTEKYSFPRSFFSMCICWGLLYWGGFFDKVV